MALTPKEDIRKAMLEAQRKARKLDEQQEETSSRIKRDMFSTLKRQINALKRSLPPEVFFVEVLFIFMIALTNDVLDWLFIGSIPVIGDIMDLATWIIISSWIWWRGFKRPTMHFLAGLVEFIPFADILPVWSFYVVGIVLYNEFHRMAHMKKIKKMLATAKEARKIAEAPV
ncbi:MAG: hypothetical protein HY445_03550 [Candidatus Niyogibacteria bacterium]|nr:hypothetical protein [Candidatus Niyogibacteria bacterium]